MQQAPASASGGGFRVPRGPTISSASPEMQQEPEQLHLPLERGEGVPFYAYLFAPARGATPGSDGAFGEIVVAPLPDGVDAAAAADEGDAPDAPAASEHICGVWWPIRGAPPSAGDNAEAAAVADWHAARRVAMQRSRHAARTIAKHEQECERRKQEVMAARSVQATSAEQQQPTTIDDYVSLRVGRASAIGRLLRERNGRRNGIRNLEKLQALLDQVVEAFGLLAEKPEAAPRP